MVEDVCASSFAASRANAAVCELRSRGFQPASVVGGWRRDMFLNNLAEAGEC